MAIEAAKFWCKHCHANVAAKVRKGWYYRPAYCRRRVCDGCGNVFVTYETPSGAKTLRRWRTGPKAPASACAMCGGAGEVSTPPPRPGLPGVVWSCDRCGDGGRLRDWWPEGEGP